MKNNLIEVATTCVLSLQRDELDAVSLDATHSFIAGKCGLVPVVTEYYGKTVYIHKVHLVTAKRLLQKLESFLLYIID